MYHSALCVLWVFLVGIAVTERERVALEAFGWVWGEVGWWFLWMLMV